MLVSNSTLPPAMFWTPLPDAMLYELSAMHAQSYPSTAELPRLTPSSSEYYPRVTISALMKILLDSTLSIHHTTVTQAIMFTFQTLGLKCMPFLKDVVPCLVLGALRTPTVDERQQRSCCVGSIRGLLEKPPGMEMTTSHLGNK